MVESTHGVINENGREEIDLETIKTYKSESDIPYRIFWKRLVGRGAFGQVYRATRGSELTYAMKVISIKDSKHKGYAIREIDSLRRCNPLGRLGHPNILKLVEVFKIDEDHPDSVFLATSPFAQASLGDFFNSLGEGFGSKKDQKWSWFQRGATSTSINLLDLMHGCISGLEYIHERGLKHKDIKPDNIMLHCDSSTSTPKPIIIDFGISKSAAEKQLYSGSTTFSSTYEYTAPEQAFEHENLQKSDLFSLGICFALILGVASEYQVGYKKIVAPAYNYDRSCRFADHIDGTRDALLALWVGQGIHQLVWKQILNDVSYHMLVPRPEYRATASQIRYLVENNWKNPCHRPMRDPKPYSPVSEWEQRNEKKVALLPYQIQKPTTLTQASFVGISTTAAKFKLSSLNLEPDNQSSRWGQKGFVSSQMRIATSVSGMLTTWLRHESTHLLWLQGPVGQDWASTMASCFYASLLEKQSVSVVAYDFNISSSSTSTLAAKMHLFGRLIRSLISQVTYLLPDGIESTAPSLEDFDVLKDNNLSFPKGIQLLSNVLAILPTRCVFIIDNIQIVDYSNDDVLNTYLNMLLELLASPPALAISHSNPPKAPRHIKTLLTTSGSTPLLRYDNIRHIQMAFDASIAAGRKEVLLRSIVSQEL